MKFDYMPLVADVLELIEEFGVEMHLIKDASDGYDPVTGEHSDPVPGARQAFTGIRMNITADYSEKIGAGNIQERDMLILLGPTVEPKLEDEVEVDNQTWQIANVFTEHPRRYCPALHATGAPMIEPPSKRNRINGPQLSTNTSLALGDQIRAVAEKTGDDLNTVHRILALKLFTSITYATPVDEGIARGSWHASTGSPSPAPKRVDKTGQSVVAEIKAITDGSSYNDVVYFTNRIPYIIPLEYGWSQKQAPEGMVRLNIARFRGLLSRTVAEVKSK